MIRIPVLAIFATHEPFATVVELTAHHAVMNSKGHWREKWLEIGFTPSCVPESQNFDDLL